MADALSKALGERMARRRYHHGSLRSELLARAEWALRNKGRQALSLRELTREVGVSPSAPSRHFKTKQAMLDALALVGFERLEVSIATSQADVGESFAERLDAMARAYLDFAVANAALHDLMYPPKRGPEASLELGRAAGRGFEQLFELIGEGQRRGEVRPGAVDRIGLPVVAALHGYASLAVTGMVPSGMAVVGLDDVITSVLRGCESERPAPQAD
jgi:AcrR family transcriptional regulator